jgi:hypothetical protein
MKESFLRAALAGLSLLAAFAVAVPNAAAAMPAAGAMSGGQWRPSELAQMREARSSLAANPGGVYAVAAPITYQFSGTADGVLGETPFTNASIVVQGVGDLFTVSNNGDIWCNPLASVTITIDKMAPVTVTDTLAIFDTHSIGAIGLWRGCNTSDWIGMYDPAFNTYDLSRAYGPATGSRQYVQGALNTTAGTLSLTATFITTFVAGEGGVLPAPAAAVSPSSLDFGARTVATTSTAQTVTLANSGTGALAIRSIGISGDFAFSSACPSLLSPGTSCTIDVSFTPLVVGPRAGTLTITHDAPGSPSTVSLAGSGLAAAAPVADVSPGTLVFSAQPVGSESGAQAVVVTNSGNAPLVFDDISITGDFRAVAPPAGDPTPACEKVVEPGAACQIAIVFDPTAPNVREGVLTVSSNAGRAVVSLSGTGVIAEPPQLRVPASLTFPLQAVGTRSPGKPLLITNASPYPATLLEVVVDGDFSISHECATIQPGASCTILVFFEPGAIGARLGAIVIRTQRDLDPYVVQLSGASEENRLPVLQLSATFVGFGNTFVGMGVSRDIILRNVGLGPLVVSSLGTTGAFFADSACAVVVAGGSCTLRLTFVPATSGAQFSALRIDSNDPAGPHTVSLSGTGCFLPTPSRLRFGALLCG